MATYVLLTTLTPEGRQTLRKNPDRVEVNKEVEQFGCKVIAQYAVLGSYDFVSVVEAPDNETAAHLSVDLGSRGTGKHDYDARHACGCFFGEAQRAETDGASLRCNNEGSGTCWDCETPEIARVPTTLLLRLAPPLPRRHRIGISPESASRFTCRSFKPKEHLVFRILSIHPGITEPYHPLVYIPTFGKYLPNRSSIPIAINGNNPDGFSEDKVGHCLF